MKRRILTVSEGLEIQRNHLECWRLKLIDNCYKDLEEYVKKENSFLTKDSTGYDVTRGNCLDCFVLNWKPQK